MNYFHKDFKNIQKSSIMHVPCDMCNIISEGIIDQWTGHQSFTMVNICLCIYGYHLYLYLCYLCTLTLTFCNNVL
ncbi:hypothetical protein KUTeg_020647 [Tegillarca granosa]|uniref:Uncharacterized protein n=1 Tax=Tegillarca granosa TaxID=220873 RepID=A0ABQ9EDT5_TEGGR|nr:hypothetical protein KUTeg_020647 [Tegillarca granosa]